MNIEWASINSKKYLEFTFTDYLEEQEALDGIEKWKREFDGNSDDKISIIWDCSKMNGYNRQARRHWQKTTKELKDRIEIIWLISDSLLIRTGAELISLFARIKIKAVDSEDKIA